MGLDSFVDEVILDINVFGVSMVGWVFGEDDSSSIVIIDPSSVLRVSHKFN